MLQWGAAVTDWALGLSCLACAGLLKRRLHNIHKRWKAPFVVALTAEGVACCVGGFLWSLEVNLKEQHELSLVHWLVTLTVVLGMAAEGLALLTASVALAADKDAKSVRWWRDGTIGAFAVVCVYVAIAVASGARGTLVLQPAAAPMLGWPALLEASRRVGPREGVSPRLVGVASALNVAGGLVVAAFDARCSGTSSITELWVGLPGLLSASSSPPTRRAGGGGVDHAPLASCPLPPGFNHAAIMHILCAAGAWILLAALTTGTRSTREKAP